MTAYQDSVVLLLGALCVFALAAAIAGAWFLFALCCWAFLGAAFLLGVAPDFRGKATLCVVLIGLVHAGLLTAMTLIGPEERIFGLPAGWTLSVFGVWSAGILPNLFFSRIFERWVLPPGAVDKVLAAKRR